MVLITVAKEDIGRPKAALEEAGLQTFHLPLERYVSLDNSDQVEEVLGKLEEYENIIHGRKRSAIFFMEKVQEFDKLKEVQNRVNLTIHQEVADYLEAQGIPAVLPGQETRGIKLVEFMLRLQRYGKTLYPCGTHESEDIPGFLQELDIEVTELPLFELEGPDETTLEKHRQQLAQTSPDTVVFHNRRSVNRILAAFPDLNYEEVTVVSADSAITDKLHDNDIEADVVAAGSWQSIAEKLAETDK